MSSPVNLNEELENYFSYSSFREGQQEVVTGLMDGHSMLAVFPTGGGKSLCYQLPALLLPGITVVVSPLIALMKDQVDALQKRGIAAARLDSSLSLSEYAQVMKKLKHNELKLLYVAPERLANENFRNHLCRLDISLVAIDEAHCISEWGHNFRPDYLKLSRFFHELKIPRILCLTATATPQVAQDICKEFRIAVADHIQLSFHRPNLDLRITSTDREQRDQLLLDRVKKYQGSLIVYVTRQITAESIATSLQKNNISAQAYHAGLPTEFRVAAQEKFMRGEIRVIVATIAFGMGIDKSDIRGVIHYNLPKSLENYSQEIGRAGRDGKKSFCEILACGDDVLPLENFIYGDTPDIRALRQLIDRILRLGQEFDISIYELSNATDIRLLVVNTLLAYLELEGIIAATRPFYQKYSVKLLRNSKQIIAGYSPSRKAFLIKLFKAAEKGTLWYHFDVNLIATEIDEPRERIVNALVYLEEAGDLVLKKSGIRQGYRLIKRVENVREVAIMLAERFRKRELAELQRIHQVTELVESRECITTKLLSHFGEKLENCGHCDRCRGEEVSPLQRSTPPPIDHAVLEKIFALRDKRYAALRTPRQMARFLCGISSPAQRKEKLKQHDCFALLEEYPFAEVLAMAEEWL